VNARNLTRDLVLADRCRRAVRFHERLVGLLGRDRLEAGEALWIEPCSSVHTWFMRFPLDVLFVDRAGAVVAVHPGLRPFAATRLHRRARAALELPAGTIAATGTRPGDRVVLVALERDRAAG
jgi:uncharacterized membrane protein (UPF0127 family)